MSGIFRTVSCAGKVVTLARASMSQICTIAGLPLGESLPQMRYLSLQNFNASMDRRSVCSRLLIDTFATGRMRQEFDQ
jgi:hypothetical protein